MKSSPTSSPTKDIYEAQVGDYENVVERLVFRFKSEFLELQEVDAGKGVLRYVFRLIELFFPSKLAGRLCHVI